MNLGNLRRAWWKWRGDEPVAVTFWPRDYPLGAAYSVNGRRYHITRYTRSAENPRVFDVWGRAAKSRAFEGAREHEAPARRAQMQRAG